MRHGAILLALAVSLVGAGCAKRTGPLLAEPGLEHLWSFDTGG